MTAFAKGAAYSAEIQGRRPRARLAVGIQARFERLAATPEIDALLGADVAADVAQTRGIGVRHAAAVK